MAITELDTGHGRQYRNHSAPAQRAMLTARRNWSRAQATEQLRIIYHCLLNCNIDSKDSGAQRWLAALMNAQMSIQDVVRAVAYSRQYHDRLNSLPTIYDAIAVIYQDLLGRSWRTISQQDIDNWAAIAIEYGFNAVI